VDPSKARRRIGGKREKRGTQRKKKKRSVAKDGDPVIRSNPYNLPVLTFTTTKGGVPGG